MSMTWQLFVLICVGAFVIGHFIFLLVTARMEVEAGQEETTGHVWDENVREYNKPLPRWWLTLFHGTLAWGVLYLILYPGSTVFEGTLGWNQIEQYEAEVAAAEQKYGAVFAAMAAKDLVTLASDEAALSAGFNLFGNNCAQCHGSAGRGAVGFPNLTDDAWLWGGQPQTIEQSILNGRNGVMPAWGGPLGGDAEVEKVAHYVLSLSGAEHDATLAQQGQQKFSMFCVACHGPSGEGNAMLGAPNLTDDDWLYRADVAMISDIIANGRNNEMPAFADSLGPERVKVLAAYVYSLSQ